MEAVMDHTLVDTVAVAFEIAGIVVMVLGFAIALVLGAVTLVRQRSTEIAFHRVRSSLGGAILLGLEILVAADIVKTVTSELELDDVLALGFIVLIRTILSFTIQIEIDGHLPWQRALTESGAVHIARAVRDTAAKPVPAGADAQGSAGQPVTKEGG